MSFVAKTELIQKLKDLNNLDSLYCSTLLEILTNHEDDDVVSDRTNVGIYKIFGNLLTVDLSEGFPLLLSRRIPFKSLLAEFVFFVNGCTNNNWLLENKCKFWNEFAHPETGELGPVYGAQLRNFNNQGYDQLAELIDGLKNRPFSRRHLFTYLNPLVVPDESLSHKENVENGRAVLPPCHILYQFNVRKKNNTMYLDGMLTMRSSDWCVGAPSNIAQMGLWIYTLAKICGHTPGKLVFSTGNTHVYANHLKGAEELLNNFMLLDFDNVSYPTLEIGDIKSIEDIKIDAFNIKGYQTDSRIKFDLAV